MTEPEWTLRDSTDGLVRFFGSEEKAKLWWATPNPHLGGLSPAQMVARGREAKLSRFIQQQFTEGRRVMSGEYSDRGPVGERPPPPPPAPPRRADEIDMEYTIERTATVLVHECEACGTVHCEGENLTDALLPLIAKPASLWVVEILSDEGWHSTSLASINRCKARRLMAVRQIPTNAHRYRVVRYDRAG